MTDGFGVRSAIGAGHRGDVRVAESVAATIRERILADDIPGGMLPRQEDLVAEFGVSPPSIREALRILEVEGLVQVRRGKMGGSFVQRPNEASAAYSLALVMQGRGVLLTDLAEVLLTMEPMCAASCAEREDRNEVVVPLLEANLAACSAAVGNGPELTHRAREFHDLVVQHTPNMATKLTVLSLVAIWSIQMEIWAGVAVKSGSYPSRDEQSHLVDCHSAIVRAISAGNAKRAERLAREHIRESQQLVLERVGDQVVNGASPRAVIEFRRLTSATAAGDWPVRSDTDQATGSG